MVGQDVADQSAVGEGCGRNARHDLPVGRSTNTREMQRARKRCRQYDGGRLLPEWNQPIRCLRHVWQRLGMVLNSNKAWPARVEGWSVDQPVSPRYAIIVQRRR